MPERRRHLRLSSIVIRSKLRLGERSIEGYLTSLSMGGAFLTTDEPLHPGDVVELRFSLPWQLGEVSLEAQVRYEQPRGVGLRFLDLVPEAEEKLRLYVQRFQNLAAQMQK